MSKSTDMDLKKAQDLFDNGRYNEALQIAEKFEVEKDIGAREHFDLLMLKGQSYEQLGRFEEALNIVEELTRKSQTLGSKLHTFDALSFKRDIYGALREYNEMFQAQKELENLFITFKDIPPTEQMKREASLALFKGSISYHFQKEFTKAIENLNKCLKIREKLGNKSRIAEALMEITRLYYFHGDLDQAITYTEQIIANIDFPKIYKCKAHSYLVYSLRAKGELERAIKINKQWQKLAKEVNHKQCLAASLRMSSDISRMQGDLDRALEFGKRSFEISVRPQQKLSILRTLIEISLEKKNSEEANKYLLISKQIDDQSKNKRLNRSYLLSKAIILKSSTYIRDRVKAEMILKDFVKFESSDVHVHESALLHLCDLLLVELRRSNDMNLFDEINPIINRLSENAINQNSTWKLAETYLLKAKLAFIQMNMGEARKFLTQAQELADNKGLGLLAQKISNEHDILLDQLSKWEKVKEKEPPLSERIELSSFEGVIKRLLETRAADPPEVIGEDPILLMIMTEGGVLLFSYPFTDEWKRDNQLFGSFLTAFTSFSSEFFSEGLDRVKFGQYTVLMETVDVFSIGYVYKGQTYPAKQKLKYFIEKIQNSAPIWQILEKFYQTSQVIEFKDFPFLEAFITDIFSGNVPHF